MNKFPCDLQQRLSEHDQAHVCKFWDELLESEQREFILQLESIDFDMLEQKIDEVKHGEVRPASVIPLDDTYLQLGEERIRLGELGVLTVAGGQGTRLGWSGPKGTYPATPVTGKSLFQVIAEQITFASKKYDVAIPWYIMTSRENDSVTRSFLRDNNCFGIDRKDIFLFTQGEVPVVDKDGNLLLASKSSVAMNPDGHGGVIEALQKSGGLDEMMARGIKHLSFVQIDNPLVHVIDASFLGYHVSEHSSMEVSSKCVKKSSAEERVGVFCDVEGKTTIVEYSDLSNENATKEHTDGELVFGAGSIAIHMMSTEFLQRIANTLPWHRAHKKVPYFDVAENKTIYPVDPNAYKYEKFVFDVLPLAEHSLVLETKREEEFAPIKNKDGDDSSTTSYVLQRDRAARWLRKWGVRVPDSATVEVSPLTASTADDLSAVTLPEEIGENETVVF